MVRLWRILAFIALISLLIPAGCAQEEEPDIVVEDPRERLVEVLQLTDEQLEQLESGTGTLQLREDQVDILSDYVTQQLDDLEPWLDEAQWQQVNIILESMVTQGEVDLVSLGPVLEAIDDSLISEAEASVGVYTNLVKLPTESTATTRKQGQLLEESQPSIVVTLYAPIDSTVGDKDFEHPGVVESFTRGLGGESVGAADGYSGAVGAYSDAAIMGGAHTHARQQILINIPADNTDLTVTTTLLYSSATSTAFPSPSGVAGTDIVTVHPYRYTRGEVSYQVIDPIWTWGDAVWWGLTIVSMGAALPVQCLIHAATVLQALADDQAYRSALEEDGTEEIVTYSAESLAAGDYVFEIGVYARAAATIGVASAFVFGMIPEIEVTLDIPSFTLAVSSTDGGQVTQPGEGTLIYYEGTVVHLVATPDADYQFVNWTGDVDTIEDIDAASTTMTMNGDYSITANFEEIPPDQYTLSISSSAGGSVITPGEGSFSYDAGTVIDLVAEADEGYEFVNWIGDVDTIADVEAAETAITMDGDYTITANFEEIPTVRYDLTISSSAGGLVTTPGEGTSAYDAGTVVSLVATSASGYQFVNWTGDVGTVGNVNAPSTTIAMDGSYSITANFEEIPTVQYGLTMSGSAGGSVTTPGEGSFTYDAGMAVNLVAEAEEGYRFVNWTGDVGTIANVNAASTSITMNGNYSITANFEEEEAVYFPDPNLEAAIREAIGKPTGPIYPSDLEGLTSLSAADKNITDLTGLEHCTNLTYLHLGGNQISDISPLANLTNLLYLCLSWNQISDISALANLTNLVNLYLRDNQISDISALANLTNLAGLHLSDNQISNTSALANLTNLRWLELSGNQISDISALANLTNLVSLYLRDNQISDISPLVDNPGMGVRDQVYLNNNPLSEDSINIYIPELEARGVTVYF